MDSVGFYIPSYNAAKTLSLCLEAVLSQTYPVREVLVVDDGSTDETAAIATRYPVRLIRHASNRGLAATRNSAIKEMDASFIASVDADCVCEKDWLAKLMVLLKSADIAGAGGKLIERHATRPADAWRSVHMKQHWGDSGMMPPFLFGSNTVFRKDALEKAGRYDESLGNNYEDVDLCERIKKAGFTLAYAPEALATHLRRDDAISALNNYWGWYQAYYHREEFYANPERFRFKMKENIGTANRYLEEDMASGRCSLVYLDFLLAFHHSLKDLKIYMAKQHGDVPGDGAFTPLSLWLAFVDLVFFYSYDYSKPSLETFLKPVSAFEQNCLALLLNLGRFLAEKFPPGDFMSVFFRDLLRSFFGVDDLVLTEKILFVIQNHPDWDGFLKKAHPYLDSTFLDAFTGNLMTYVNSLISSYPDAVAAMGESAKMTQEAS